MHSTMSYTARFDENNQEIVLAGSIRPKSAGELAELRKTFDRAIQATRGTLYLNAKRLVQLNNAGFQEITHFVKSAGLQKPNLKISVITSSYVGWSLRKFSLLQKIGSNVTVEQYDKDFYPGQSVLEDSGFIPILRTQTKMTWRHERDLLPRHGLKPAMAVADICCGIGDFAALVYKEFQPSRLLAIDHSKPSLAYARKVASDFHIEGIEYVHGDAANLLVEDNEFDFVTCRHSLQVFDRPELILKELFRICKPGGRVYITNEKNSHCLGEPRADSIQWTYNEVARLWAHFKMDIELGPKSRRFLLDAGFDDVQVESFMVTNRDGDPQDFADVIASWEDVYAGQMAVQRGDTAEFIARFRQGFQDHISAALHPKGYAGWPIWAASARKPR
jgi:ubiquinone/menaquinone biosynthesis C-methylase UbiE/ABC-type transporter Mla MlaB component